MRKIFFILLALLPLTTLYGQQNRTDLKTVPGKEILEELRLREAAAVKADTKMWTKGLRAESFYKNEFIKSNATELKEKAKSSKLKAFSTSNLFDELRQRALVNKGIFGPDDRRDIFRIEAQRDEIAANGADTSYFDGVLKNSKGICCLINKSRLMELPDGSFKMFTSPYSESQHDTLKLCADERFFSQPVGAFCSGFLVGPDVVITAGHCVKETDLANARFIFGYRMKDNTTAVTTFPKTDVYSGKELLGRVLDENTGEDWAVVRLDRTVLGATPLKFRKTGKIANDSGLYVIGFPSGLPCKFADNATVRDNSDTFVFAGNLDTYGGNSGSAVFNRTTHEIEGILVRGGQDYQFVSDGLSGCIRSVVLTDNVGREACTRSTVWAAKVP